MFGPFSDPRVGVEIGGIFGRAGERIRAMRERSVERENVGNRARTETSDTDQLINDFQTAIESEIEHLGTRTLGERVDFGVEFYPTNLPVSEENQYGADIGVRLHIEGDGFNISKGVLFQCKRMYNGGGSPSYNALRGDGEEQAEKMLKITPASFFLFFNGVQAETLAGWMKPPAGIYSFDEDFGPFPNPWHFFWRLSPRHSVSYSLWNPGVTVIPASRVYAESRVSRRERKALSTEASHWVRASIPLGLFMADQLGSCFVGDVRASVLRLVTPPELRDLKATGVEDEEPSMFPVRRLMELIVKERPA